MIVNMSVWESIEALAAFVYRSGHVEVMRRRREWFEPMKPYRSLWWIPAGTIPTVDEAKERLSTCAAHGPTPYAFTFKARFPPPDAERRGRRRRRAGLPGLGAQRRQQLEAARGRDVAVSHASARAPPGPRAP